MLPSVCTSRSTFACFAAERNVALTIFGGPFLVLGALFLLARRRPTEVPIER